MEEPKIKIPKVKDADVVNIPKGTLGDLKNHFNRQFSKIDKLLFAIVTTVVISVVAVIISTLGIFIDQMRYNNAAYKDYTQELESVSANQTTDQLLLTQDEKDQKTIIDQQTEIQQLLNK